ncbi:MAG TPA: FecR family protein [Bacteroidetes bacterium]|nr:FecR family protein [Bacteroidota bacterium]
MGKKKNAEIFYSTFKRFFYGKTSEAKNEQVREWLNHPANKFRTDLFLRMLWDEIQENPHDESFNQEALLEKIHYTIKEKRGKTEYEPYSHETSIISTGKIYRQLARVAAILLLPVMMYLAWEVFSQRMWLESQKEIVYNEIVCPLGARCHFELPDGTRVSLNNGSRLKYPVKFQGDIRKVELAGEAFFDVKKNTKRPFIIETHGLDVKVTGTRLNVFSYPGDEYQEFTLECGTIELLKKEGNRQVSIAAMKSGQHAVYNLKEAQMDVKQDKKDKKLTEKATELEELGAMVSKMKPDERVVYETDEGIVEFEYKEDIDKYTSWKEGKLVLRNDPMPILLKRIERWYHVKFNIVDEGINEYSYWATFEQENLNRVLDLLSLTGPIKFVKHPIKKEADGSYKPQVIDVMLKK